MFGIRRLLSAQEQIDIVDLIHQIETGTSAELRVHLERKCPNADTLDRAKQLFQQLGMHQTEHKNGVLLYVAYDDRRCAVYGGEAIDAQMGQERWTAALAAMTRNFAEKKYSTGLKIALSEIGDELKKSFPSLDGGEDELPNTISWGD